jgi:hypothetical protein
LGREDYWEKAEGDSSSHAVVNASCGRELREFQGKSGIEKKVVALKSVVACIVSTMQGSDAGSSGK